MVGCVRGTTSRSGCQLHGTPAWRKPTAAPDSLNFTAACPQTAANSKSVVTKVGTRRRHWEAGAAQVSPFSKCPKTLGEPFLPTKKAVHPPPSKVMLQYASYDRVPSDTG